MPAPLVVDNPFTGEPACTVELASVEGVVRVLDKARAAQRSFRTSTVADRAAICERAVAAMETHKDAIASDISAMMGKPIAQARDEIAGMAMRARHMISIAEDSLREVIVPRKD